LTEENDNVNDVGFHNFHLAYGPTDEAVRFLNKEKEAIWLCSTHGWNKNCIYNLRFCLEILSGKYT